MNTCNGCGMMMQTGWIACPFCGNHVDNVFNSSLSMVEIVKNQCSSSCATPCGKSKRKVKSKCCGKHQRKEKYCKSCPSHPLRLQQSCSRS